MAKLMALLSLIAEGRERKRMKQASGFCKSDMTCDFVAFSVLDVARSNYHRTEKKFPETIGQKEFVLLEKGIRVVPIRR